MSPAADSALNDAIHQNLLRAMLRIGSLTERSAAARVGPWLLIDAGVDEPRFNVALTAGPISDVAGAVALAEAWFAARSAPFRFHLRDADWELADAVRDRGFEVVESEPSMARSIVGWAPPLAVGIAVRRADSDADIRRYAEVDGPDWHEITRGIARTARSFPDFELFLGVVKGVAVATSMAVITGDVVGVFNVQTQPRARGHGFGTALTAAAMEAGRKRGATTAALQATAMGLPVYEKMGFDRRYSYVVFAPAGAGNLRH